MTTDPSCCQVKEAPVPPKNSGECCGGQAGAKGRDIDLIFWGSLAVVVAAYFAHFAFLHDHVTLIGRFTGTVFELLNTMAWGIAFGIIAMGFLSRVPREFIMSILGTGNGLKGVLRATFAGTLLDLCSHGILMVGSKLYERGASVGQVMAFLIASPWNSISLTFILITLIGLKWTLLFIAVSMVIGVISGVIFDRLVTRGVLPANPNSSAIHPDFKFWPEMRKGLAGVKWTPRFFAQTLKIGIVESRMVLRWMLLGVIIAAALRVLFSPEDFQHFFGPSVLGLMITLFAATVIEVCSEGSTPIAADILNRAAAPGNAFVFLMAGVSTDYTEIMVLREATKSWKTALFLPLITVPQVLLVGYLMNRFG